MDPTLRRLLVAAAGIAALIFGILILASSGAIRPAWVGGEGIAAGFGLILLAL